MLRRRRTDLHEICNGGCRVGTSRRMYPFRNAGPKTRRGRLRLPGGRNRRPRVTVRLPRPRLQEGGRVPRPGRHGDPRFGDHESDGGRATTTPDRSHSEHQLDRRSLARGAPAVRWGFRVAITFLAGCRVARSVRNWRATSAECGVHRSGRWIWPRRVKNRGRLPADSKCERGLAGAEHELVQPENQAAAADGRQRIADEVPGLPAGSTASGSATSWRTSRPRVYASRAALRASESRLLSLNAAVSSMTP
jgi:hypothetical protein